jgi:hypothetical protein
LEGRVEFPGSPHAPLGGPGTAWTVFNRYRAARWAVLAFDGPRSVEPRVELRGWFVWDTADLDRDGRAELLATRVERGYRAPWAFDVLRWNGHRFRSSFHRRGVVPALLRYANTPTKHTTEENVFGALTRRGTGGTTELLVERYDGRLSWLTWKRGR